MNKPQRVCLVFWIAVIASNLSAQDITNQGAGNLKLGMSAQQFKNAFPAAQIKKEVYAGDEEIVGIIVRAGNDHPPGIGVAKATFYQRKISALNLLSQMYKLNGVPIGATIKDLKGKINIESIYYAPDGEEAGIAIRLTDITNVNITWSSRAR